MTTSRPRGHPTLFHDDAVRRAVAHARTHRTLTHAPRCCSETRGHSLVWLRKRAPNGRCAGPTRGGFSPEEVSRTSPRRQRPPSLSSWPGNDEKIDSARENAAGHAPIIARFRAECAFARSCYRRSRRSDGESAARTKSSLAPWVTWFDGKTLRAVDEGFFKTTSEGNRANSRKAQRDDRRFDVTPTMTRLASDGSSRNLALSVISGRRVPTTRRAS